MKEIVIQADLFTSAASKPGSEAVLEVLLRALTLANNVYLESNPKTPPLYEAGVRYEREKYPAEVWKNIGNTLADGYGDCEDLACWRCSELQIRQGIQAWPMFTSQWLPARSLWLYHIIVRYPDGETEDPSRRLGM